VSDSGTSGEPWSRIGLLGGTFDPPHIGHLIAAQDVAEALDLDGIRFEVAARSPLKLDHEPAAGDARLAMVEAAVSSAARFRAGRSELERGGTSYTIDTLRALKVSAPSVEWFLIIGTDQLAQFHEWREPEEVARLASLVVVQREGADRRAVAPAGLRLSWRSVDVTRVDVSSTQVRDRLRAGRSIRYLVPEPVRGIIEERGLYRAVRTDVPVP
jgi:nicotinate-nucleotide adenylyltransferase